jgi:hypothetical protein
MRTPLTPYWSVLPRMCDMRHAPSLCLLACLVSAVSGASALTAKAQAHRVIAGIGRGAAGARRAATATTWSVPLGRGVSVGASAARSAPGLAGSWTADFPSLSGDATAAVALSMGDWAARSQSVSQQALLEAIRRRHSDPRRSTEVIVLAPSPACGLTVVGQKVPATQVLLVGRAWQIYRAMLAGTIAFPKCQCRDGTLGGPMCPIGRMLTRREAMGAGFPSPATGVVKFVMLSGRDFVRLWERATQVLAAGRSSGTPPTLPPRQPPFVLTSSRSQSSSCDAGCAPLRDIEVSPREATFTLGCEDGLQVDVSTTGEVEVKVKRGSVTLVAS